MNIIMNINMGNKKSSPSAKSQTKEEYTPVRQFKFLEPFIEENSTNGLCLNDFYLPEEIIENILSYVPPKDLLGLTLVCKKWCNVIKSESFWMARYNRCYPDKAKKLPWYVFYCYFATKNFENLLKNGNGQEQYKHWTVIKNLGDQFRIEDPPCGSDPLPIGVPEFNGHTSCFATSYQACTKVQAISLKDKRLLRYILNKFKPHIYVSEWVAGRFDCGCCYKLNIRLCTEDYDDELNYNTFDAFNIPEEDSSLTKSFFDVSKETRVEQWQGKAWEKVEILVKEYPPNVDTFIFGHEGRDTQFWAGHYGSKMAGGVVKVMFDTIQPLGEEEETRTRNWN